MTNIEPKRRARRRLRRGILLTLVLTLSLQACVSLTPEQQRFYGLYLTDPEPVPLDAPSRSAGVAALLSLLIPGLGHAYLGEWGWAAAWFFLLGPLTYPIGAPIAAAIDTPTVNKGLVADEYRPVYMAQEGRRRKEEEDRRNRIDERQDRREEQLHQERMRGR